MLSFTEYSLLCEGTNASADSIRDDVFSFLNTPKASDAIGYDMKVELFSTGNHKYGIRIGVDEESHSGRDVILKSLANLLRTNGFDAVDHIRAKDSYVDVNKVHIVCKTTKRKGSAYTFKDYIKDNCPFKGELRLTDGSVTPSIVFKNAKILKRYVESVVASNPKFTDSQRLLIYELLKMKTGSVNVRKLLKENPNILISFGEVLIPLMCLCGKIQLEVHTSKGKTQLSNTGGYSKSLYFPTSSQNQKFDFAIKYGDGDGDVMVVSQKYGKGHGQSVLSAIKSMTNPSDNVLKTLNKNLNSMSKVRALWDSLLPKVNGVSPSKYYDMLPQNYADYEKVSDDVKKLFDNLKGKIEGQYLNGVSDKKLMLDHFPYSLNYILYSWLRNYIQTQCLSEFRHQVLGGDYYQCRINQNSAKRGLFEYEFIFVENEENRNLNFTIGCASTDITSKYDLGYKIV